MCLAGASDDAEDEEIAEDGPPPAKFQVRKGTLYIVATPIGNLEDITVRALAVLHGVDVIASEDTRRTGRLLKHFGIATPQVSHHEHNWRAASVQLVKRMQTGESVAVVSDAGTPGIADPGTELVRACVAGGVRVEPVPGACAAVAAVSAAGLAGDGFAFRGFLPPKGAARREALLAACASTVPVVLYEAPHRLLLTLRELCAEDSTRPLLVARELTKMHEELVHGTVAEAVTRFESIAPKGEFTLVLGSKSSSGSAMLEAGDAEIREMVAGLMRDGMSASSAAKTAAKFLNVPNNRVKQLARMVADGEGDVAVDERVSAVPVVGLDHVVLRARSLPRLEAFYAELLDTSVERRNDAFGMVHLRTGTALLDIIQADPTRPAPGDGADVRNVDHFAFSLSTFDEPALTAHVVRVVAADSERYGETSAAGPAVEVHRRYGAGGFGRSLYVSDPEGNSVELKGPPEGDQTGY